MIKLIEKNKKKSKSNCQPKRRSTGSNLNISRWDAIAFDVDEAQKKAKSRNKKKRESSR